jgi:putative DNA primase/helicase
MINADCDLVYGGGNKGPTQEKILNEWFTEYQEKVSVGPENINPNGLYNFPNGVYNAKTGKFEEKNDECIFTYVMPYKYDPNADCPQVRKRIDEWMEGAEHQTETLLGYVGLGAMGIATSTEKFCLLSGKTRNGKSMFLDMIRGTLGVENISGLSLSNITDPQMSSNLIGKALNLCDESGKNDTEGPTRFSRGYTKTTDWDALKLVTSGQPIVCNEKHKHPYEFVNKAAIIISANQIPKSFGPDDKAIRSRLLHVRFRNDFGPDSGRMVPKQKLYEEFEAERPGIFNLIMKHGKKAQQDGLKISDKMKQSIESITDHVDTFKLFMDDCVELDDLNTKNKDLLKSKDIYKHYTNWYIDELGGEREFMLKTHFSFSKHLCAYLRNNDLEEYFKIVEKQQRFFLTIRPWRQEGDDEYAPPPF